MEGKEERYSTGRLVRLGCRQGAIQGCTAGLAPGFVQANLIILSQNLALQFATYCVRNSQACPLLEVTDPGNPHSDLLGKNCDITTDLPKYCVHKDQKTVEKYDVVDEWKNDSVGFVFGCSFTFEEALQREGIPVRHIDEGVNVPMFITNRETVPSGPFHGPLVVSMRPIHHSLVAKATEITAKFPKSHGSPIHKGDPAAIGIRDLSQPDFGDAVSIKDDEIPVFWACGVTALVAMKNVEEWMSHAPGCMLVTDTSNEA